MSLTDFKTFNVISSILLGIMVIFLSINIYYHYQNPNYNTLSSNIMLILNIILIIISILLFTVSFYRIFNNERYLNIINAGPIAWVNGKLTAKGRNGMDVTVKRISGNLYVNVENSEEFYECPNGKCREEIPTDKFIRENYPQWVNARTIPRR